MQNYLSQFQPHYATELSCKRRLLNEIVNYLGQVTTEVEWVNKSPAVSPVEVSKTVLI